MKACRLTLPLANWDSSYTNTIKHKYTKNNNEIREQIYNIYIAVKRENFSCGKYIYIYHLFKVSYG